MQHAGFEYAYTDNRGYSALSRRPHDFGETLAGRGRSHGGQVEEQYRTLFEMAPDVIYSISATDGTFTALSPTFEAITGWPVHEWLGKSFAGIVHPDDLPLAFERFQQGLRGEIPPPYELRIRSRSGEYLVGEFRARPQIEQGRVIGKIGIARDVTARKRAEDALRFLAQASETLASSLDYQTTLANVARLAVPQVADWCVVDLVVQDGSIRRVAAAHADPEKERWAQEAEKKYPLDGRGAVASALARRCSNLVSQVTDDMLVSAARDTDHLALLRSMGIRSAMTVPLVARERVLGAITFMSTESGRRFGAQDLTLAEDLARHAALAVDNARLYDEARESLRLRDEFLSIASHELRTPLTSLHLQVQMLRRVADRLSLDSAGAERVTRAIQGADRQVTRLSKLVTDLLDVSRIAAGRIELEREETDLAALVREVAGRFDIVTSGGSTLRVEASLPVIGCWDRFRIDQIVTNLISNAVKYGNQNPIDITVTSDRARACVSVRDRGGGIAPEHLARIFDRFERVNPGNRDGLGLGLYICRQLVEAHGGTIQVTSRLGVGSDFRVELPLRAEQANCGDVE